MEMRSNTVGRDMAPHAGHVRGNIFFALRLELDLRIACQDMITTIPPVRIDIRYQYHVPYTYSTSTYSTDTCINTVYFARFVIYSNSHLRLI